MPIRRAAHTNPSHSIMINKLQLCLLQSPPTIYGDQLIEQLLSTTPPSNSSIAPPTAATILSLQPFYLHICYINSHPLSSNNHDSFRPLQRMPKRMMHNIWSPITNVHTKVQPKYSTNNREIKGINTYIPIPTSIGRAILLNCSLGDHNTIPTQTIRRQLTPPTQSTPTLTPRHTYCLSDRWSPLNNSIMVQIHGT